MIDLFFVKTLNIDYLNKTLKSFYDTVDAVDTKDFDIHIVNELATREETLNYILTKRDINNDLLIIADDIILTKNWYKSLKENLNNGDIIGFSMINPKKNKLHNSGFDFIKVDNKLTYRPYMYNVNIDTELKSYRKCDAIVGCAMYIKKQVFDTVKHFPLDGYNRWGELLFCAIAKKHSFNVIVLGHKLYHHSISSKQKNEKRFSSISWLIEKKMWDKIVNKYLSGIKNVPNYNNTISDSLKQLLQQCSKILIYGCGTVADIILKNVNSENIDIASGLSEEIGLIFNNKTILDIKKVDLKSYGKIIISAIGYEEEIKEKYFQKYKNLLFLSKKEKDSIIEIGVNSCTQQHL